MLNDYCETKGYLKQREFWETSLKEKRLPTLEEVKIQDQTVRWTIAAIKREGGRERVLKQISRWFWYEVNQNLEFEERITETILEVNQYYCDFLNFFTSVPMEIMNFKEYYQEDFYGDKYGQNNFWRLEIYLKRAIAEGPFTDTNTKQCYKVPKKIMDFKSEVGLQEGTWKNLVFFSILFHEYQKKQESSRSIYMIQKDYDIWIGGSRGEPFRGRLKEIISCKDMRCSFLDLYYDQLTWTEPFDGGYFTVIDDGIHPSIDPRIRPNTL